MPRFLHGAARRCAVIALCAGAGLSARAAPVEPVQSLAAGEKAAFLETLEALVSIETGSEDREGLDKISALIAERLTALGGQVELIEPDPPPADRLADLPKRIGRMVEARFTGTGTKRILLIAHMDTVYHRGMLEKQPFRLDGNRAYGLGISDDKAGIAVILHTLAILKAMNFRDYGQVTVLINADEEIGSYGSRATITRLGGESDAVFSHEGSPIKPDRLSLTTAGIGSVLLSVEGRASHAGSSPERGRNALYELAHQILQMRDLSDDAAGIKLNWTMASAGSNRNVIPAMASAVADVRVRRVADFDTIEAKVRERVKNQLIPDTKVEVAFRRGRPPLELTAVAQALAHHAQHVYAEIGHELEVNDVAAGGGTDAAYAALKTKAPVIERFGLRGFGAHSNNAEYIDMNSIEPRLYLAARMIMDVATGATE
ncbi:MAG TPA: M20/M25/M40 family metallo-hydrolase [Xanthobacteraceae bacterium]|nr:M20/M25/M40 family metallo-hydrolase [Xanthobacteraceae bacterium]